MTKKSIGLHLLLMALPILTIISCVTQRRCNEKFPPKSYDSLSYRSWYRETVHDTTVINQADSSMISALLACDSAGNVILKQLLDYKAGQHINPPNIGLKNNVLTVSAKVDSYAVYLAMKDRYFFESASSKSVKVLPPVQVNYITTWQKIQMYAGRLLMFSILAFGAYKVIRWKLKL